MITDSYCTKISLIFFVSFYFLKRWGVGKHRYKRTIIEIWHKVTNYWSKLFFLQNMKMLLRLTNTLNWSNTLNWFAADLDIASIRSLWNGITTVVFAKSGKILGSIKCCVLSIVRMTRFPVPGYELQLILFCDLLRVATNSILWLTRVLAAWLDLRLTYTLIYRVNLRTYSAKYISFMVCF